MTALRASYSGVMHSLLVFAGLTVWRHTMYNYDLSMVEKWEELYQSALLELEHSLINGRIREARGAIAERLEKLHTLPGLHTEERQAIQDALSNLRVVEREEEAEVRRAQAALDHLRSIKRPKFEGPSPE